MMKMKRNARFLALLLSLMLLICAVPAGIAFASEAGTINTDGVNLRTGPSTSYQSQGTLAKNTAVTITGTSGDWLQITVDSTGMTGYSPSRYITRNSSIVTPGTSSAYINASGVNFRTGPSTKYSSQGKLSSGTAVTVNATSGSWYKITVTSTGKVGYVFNRYVTLGSSGNTPVIDPLNPTGSTAYINASGVNFRTGPSTKYSSQGKLSSGTAVTVTGSSGSWIQLTVTSTGKSGYVFNRYVTQTSNPVVNPVNPDVNGQAGYINAASVNFRTGPSSKYKSMGLLHGGDTVTVTGSSGNWYKLTLNSTGQAGYVYSRYVTLGSVIYTGTSSPDILIPPTASTGTGTVSGTTSGSTPSDIIKP